MVSGKQKGTVFVGISGGVDSAVSAYLLKKAGYRVVGVFIKTWQPDFIECTWRAERRDAMRVCAYLDIPFLECDAWDAYKKGVADYMISEYKKGRTPNPDVMCNREVKFGVFWDFAKKYGADYIATGHYAQVMKIGENNFQLEKSIDDSKDQSYFLWTLTEVDLSHTLFPIGHLKKEEVRAIARKNNIPVADKKDSQGVCFIGALDMKDFLGHFIESVPGDVVTPDGAVIGSHMGALLYTLGERHGFTILEKTPDDKPYYVVGKNIEKNTLTVSHSPLPSSYRDHSEIMLSHFHWIGSVPSILKNLKAVVRYHGTLYSVEVQTGEQTRLIFQESVLVASGQSIVIYDGMRCVGGGVAELG